MPHNTRGVRRIVGFGLNSADAARLTGFYETAFGARHISSTRFAGPQFEGEMDVRGGALCHTLTLGCETIQVLQFDAPGRRYPLSVRPFDPLFQHLALVVSDMNLAYAQLQKSRGWTAITNGGPQRLPRRSGGVTAFKFQDPDGHPLELLEFPSGAVPAHWQKRTSNGIFLGIDHSALSVRDTAMSAAFYRSLGFTMAARTFNHGVEQSNLDGIACAEVEVTALALNDSTPHLELLCYRSEARPLAEKPSSTDEAATRVALAVECPAIDDTVPRRLVVDPDGHHLLLVHDCDAPQPPI